MDNRLPSSFVHGILQVWLLQWVSCSPPEGLPNPGVEPASHYVSCIVRLVLLPLVIIILINSTIVWAQVNNGVQIANICWIIKKSREFQKNIYFCFTDYAKAFDCVDDNKLWKILQEMGILDHLTCLLRNLYAGQKVTVKTGHGTTDWFQIGKEVLQGCMLSPCLFNFYAEYIMRNAELDEAQAGIKIAGRNINHFRYVDDTTLMAENEEELKSLLVKVKWRVKKLA